MWRRSICPAVLAIALLFLAKATFAASRYDPALRFRSVVTPHFVIHFHQGEERLAARLAGIVEEVRAALLQWLPPRHRGRTHIVLVDQSDLPNGSATPVPYNIIEIHAAPPILEDLIGNIDDWLRVVFAHEYVHILHLDRSVGWAQVARRLFGRSPYVFPNLFLPLWQIEGIATYQESASTARGRLYAGDFFELPGAAARAGRPEPIDRTNGGLIDWPGGTAPYAYGAFFHEYLAKRFGADRLAQLADRTAGRVPYFGSPAFRAVFGLGLTQLWRDFEEELRQRALAQMNERERAARRVTHHGFVVAGPRWDPGDNSRLLYSLRTPHDFPSLMAVSIGGAPQRLMTRYLGERVAISGEIMLFEQLEVVRNVGLVGDLYLSPRRNGRFAGRPQRITRYQRVGEPDLSPDGRTVACTVVQPGGRALAILRLAASNTAGGRVPERLLGEPDTTYSAPRWSPDGRVIAVSRRRPDGKSEVVTIDVGTREVRVLLAGQRLTSPAWMPDGSALILAAQEGLEPFQLLAIDMASGRVLRLPRVQGGARSPDVSSDGRMIAFVGYTTEGYDVFTMPVDRAQWTDAQLPADAGRATAVLRGATGEPQLPAPSVRYSPVRTLPPTAWVPEVTYDNDLLKIGGSTYGVDVLARHYYFTRVLANVEGGAPDWSAYYVYDRWRPQWFASASGERSELREGRLEEYTADLGVTLPFRRIRRSMSLFGGLHASREQLTCTQVNRRPCGGQDRATVDFHSARAAITFTNARFYGYSISQTDGMTVSVTSEHVREALGASGDADALTLDARAYLPALARHHVLAIRGGAGIATGDREVRRVFNLGGSGPQTPFVEFGSDALGLLRGFDTRDASGSRIAILNVDYRFPIGRIERGYRLWPLFLRSLHGAFFADTGHAWDRRFRLSEARSSLGAELSLDVVAGFVAPVTLTSGVAWRRDGAGQVGSGPVFYARVGRAF